MRKQLLIAVLSASLMSVSAFAANGGKSPQWEFSGNTNATLNLNNQNTSGQTNIVVGGSVGYFVAPQLQIEATPSFATTSLASTSQTQFSIYAGVNYSLDSDLQNSFYVVAAPGLVMTSSSPGASTTNFSFKVDLGKRFPIASNINWAPEVDFFYTSGLTAPATASTFSIIPFQFSLFL